MNQKKSRVLFHLHEVKNSHNYTMFRNKTEKNQEQLIQNSRKCFLQGKSGMPSKTGTTRYEQ